MCLLWVGTVLSPLGHDLFLKTDPILSSMEIFENYENQSDWAVLFPVACNHVDFCNQIILVSQNWILR